MTLNKILEEWLFYNESGPICVVTRERGQQWTTKHLKQVKDACVAKSIPMKGIKYRFIRKVEKPLGGN